MTKKSIFTMVVSGILLSASSTLAASPASIDSCAVLPFAGGRDQEMTHNIALLTERYSQHLAQRRGLRVAPLRQTMQTLRKHGFRPENYTSPVTAASAAGRILGVTHVIRGQLEYAEDSYTLVTTLVNVRQGKGIRGAKSNYRGSLEKFIALTPESNISVLLGAQQAATEKMFQAQPDANGPARQKQSVPARTPPPEEETDGNYEPAIRPFRTWRLPWNGSSARHDTGTRETEAPENPFLSVVGNHLEAGARITTFSLDSTSGSFIGTINGMQQDQSRTPDLFLDWLFTPYIGLELTWDKVAAVTQTYTHPASDGSLEMKGPVLSLFGRYPFEVNIGEWTTIVSPYAGIGLAFLSADFNAEGWWHYGFATPELYNQWVANGSPASAITYSRTMTLTDDTGTALSLGCSFRVWNRLSVDLYFRSVDAGSDATFLRAYSDGNSEATHGHFPLSHKTHGLGVRYSF